MFSSTRPPRQRIRVLCKILTANELIRVALLKFIRVAFSKGTGIHARNVIDWWRRLAITSPVVQLHDSIPVAFLLPPLTQIEFHNFRRR